MSSASTKRISTDSAPADPLDALLGRFDVLVTAIETLAGELKAVAQRLLQEAESKSIQSTVASSVDLLDSSAWVKELEASAAFSARQAGICAGVCHSGRPLGGSTHGRLWVDEAREYKIWFASREWSDERME